MILFLLLAESPHVVSVRSLLPWEGSTAFSQVASESCGWLIDHQLTRWYVSAACLCLLLQSYQTNLGQKKASSIVKTNHQPVHCQYCLCFPVAGRSSTQARKAGLGLDPSSATPSDFSSRRRRLSNSRTRARWGRDGQRPQTTVPSAARWVTVKWRSRWFFRISRGILTILMQTGYIRSRKFTGKLHLIIKDGNSWMMQQ